MSASLDLKRRAIRGALTIARRAGLTKQMTDHAFRAAMIRAWLAGHRQGRRDGYWERVVSAHLPDVRN